MEIKVKCRECGKVMDNKECFKHRDETGHSKFGICEEENSIEKD